jgi:Arc/MetJ-type ribon-helix-helix transcriptional regulator
MDYESLLKLPGSEDIELLFRTGRGSTYAFHKDNTTTRNRSSEKHTDKSTGIQTRSGKTVFMSDDAVNRVAGIFQNPDMATRFVPVLDKEGKPTGKAKLELLEDYGPRKAGSTLTIVDYKTKPEVGLSPVEVYASESKIGDSGRYIHFGNKITEVKPKPTSPKLGKLAGLASLLGVGSTKASEVASEVGEALLPPGLTPSPLASGTLTPEQKAASDAAYEEKLTREKEARLQAQQSKMKAQALMRRGVVLPEERLMGWESLQNKDVEMAKGGMMKPTILGFQEGGMNVDPVSGNEVPVGSLPEEVRDDVDAKLSPGEFVIPADVVRFIGLERLMKMRDEAKKGLQRMSEIGQMGNADEVGEESNSTYEDEGFESEIDDILSEIEAEENGKDVNEQTEVMMAQGGFMKSGTDLTKAPKNPVFDVRYYKNAEGSVMYITHINGKPMTPIPEGYKAVTQEEAQKVGQKADEEKKKAATGSAADQGGYGDSQLDPAVAKFLENETPAERDARMGRINTTLERITGNLPFVGAMKKGAELIFGKPRKDLAPVETRTPTPVGSIGAAPLTATADVSMAQAAANDARQRALDSDFSSDAAARAAASAAEAVSRGVDPAVAVQAAIEAEQDVIDRESVSITGPGPSTGATASPVTSTGSTIETRDLNEPEPGIDRSGSYDYGGSSYSGNSGFGTGSDYGNQDYGSFLAKGGLVNKRQYPSKKKRGKGIAAATK